MSRLYVVESAPTNTGAKADHRVAIRPSEVERVGSGLASAVGVPGAKQASAPSPPGRSWTRRPAT